MNRNAYLMPFVRWWRLIAVVTLLAVAASALSTLFQPDIYASRTTLVIGTTFLDPNPNTNQIVIAQQLAQIYADMALREPIQLATMGALGIDWLPQYQSRVVPNTQMVEITVTDTNPQRAQIIANELANQLSLQSPTISGTETGVRQDFITEQLSSLQGQIQETEKTIEALQKNLIGQKSASQITNIEKQISEQTKKLDGLRTNYANFLANSQQGAVNILSVVEPANLPTRPVGANKWVIILLAGLVGFSLGSGAAYLLEYLDKTIKTTSDVERVFGLPVIGYISEISDNGSRATYVAENPNSIMAENFRLLQSNIAFFRINHPVKSILITSPNQGNGKTVIASNLALSLAQEEDDLILIDADLRRPAIHAALKMTRGPGLSDVLRNQENLEGVMRSWNGSGDLKIITAGEVPANVTEVVGSKRIAAILSELTENHELVIVDAPPLILSDSYNIASQVDAVIVVMEPGQTSEEQAQAMKEQLTRANAKVIGIVFNKVSEERANSFYDYQYQSLYSARYYGDYISKSPKELVPDSPSKKLMDFFEHGKVPGDLATDVENALSTIKTQPKQILGRIGKSKKNGNQ